jgi:flotillin
MTTALIWIVAALAAAAIIIAVLAWFYERATREISLVKTGIGGRRVVMDGGLIAVPYFNDISRVNMQTLRLEISRAGEQALITKDYLRVDVSVEFYVSVAPNAEGIARAAQTLGRKTFHADQLLELIEGKLVDALRSIAARLTMDELHENRGAFVADVREALGDSLARNGLELDSVSLSALDQTPFAGLDDNNAFNATGMRRLAEIIAKSKKERAEIDSDADVAVRRAEMEATRRKLQIDLEEQEAEIAQIREIETLKAAQLADVAKRKAEGERQAAQARIQMEQDIRAADIAREQAIREAEITRDKQLQEAEIARDREIEIAGQERRIAVAQKSEAESKAQVIADGARAQAVEAAEAIITVRQIAEADRRREIALLDALREAETSAVHLRKSAEAEKDAAANRAQATVSGAEARKRELIAEAEGQRALIEAENELSEGVQSMRVDLARLEALPKVVSEMVKPAEKIDSIRIHQISGLSGRGGSKKQQAGDKPLVNQAIDSILDMAVQLPALKKIGEEVGISIDKGLEGLADAGVGKSKKDKKEKKDKKSKKDKKG